MFISRTKDVCCVCHTGIAPLQCGDEYQCPNCKSGLTLVSPNESLQEEFLIGITPAELPGSNAIQAENRKLHGVLMRIGLDLGFMGQWDVMALCDQIVFAIGKLQPDGPAMPELLDRKPSDSALHKEPQP